MYNYRIDPKAMEILMDLKNEIEIETAMVNYYDTADAIIKAGVRDFMIKNNYEEAEMEKILTKMDTFISAQNLTQAVDEELKAFLSKDEVRDHLDNLVNKYNQQIYQQHLPKLSEEKQSELLEYVFEAKQVEKKLTERLLGFLDIYTGDEPATSAPEVNSITTDGTATSISSIQPAAVVEPIQPVEPVQPAPEPQVPPQQPPAGPRSAPTITLSPRE